MAHIPYEASETAYEEDILERLEQAEHAVDEANEQPDDERSPDGREIAGLIATLVGARLVTAGITPQSGGTPDTANVETWFYQHVNDTYEEGRQAARSLLTEAGYNVSETPGRENAAVHRRARAEIFGVQRNNFDRLATDLEDEIEAAVRESLDGGGSMAQARQAARERMDTVGRRRGRDIARTETGRAYNWALLSEYEEAGVEEVKIQEIRWTTAGDERVCEDCASHAGVYSIDEAKQMLKNGVLAITAEVSSDLPQFPHHTGCRCLLLPA